jgi:hypothetical protein
LVDVSHVLYNAYRLCYHRGGVDSFATVMRAKWLPFALSQPSLLAGILHVACRAFITATNPLGSRKFRVKKFHYRLACLDMARSAIAEETAPSDTTIALALLLATESVSITQLIGPLSAATGSFA